MRSALTLALVIAPAIAAAEPAKFPSLGVWKNTVKKTPEGVKAFANVSHTLYINPCLPNGCTVNPGADDSRTHRSSIAQSQRHLDAWPYGQQQWDALMQCVRETYAPFDIQITDQDPGTASHFEVMVGGKAIQLDPQLQGAGGVAPFIDCGTTSDNVITFVFAGEVNDLNFLCGAVAQESSHAWGLDHSMQSKDPMTYMDLGSRKVFQNEDQNCGEFENRQCFCGGPTQNSVQFLRNAFGASNAPAPTLTITSPADGAIVKPGFQIKASLDSVYDLASATVSIDGSGGQSQQQLVFNTPDVEGGDHTVTVAATDNGGRTAMASVNVHVLAKCTAGGSCAEGDCLGGLCLPPANVAGGLGATCTGNDECITGQCGSDGTNHSCTAPCDAGDTCPSGFECISAGSSNVCWPSVDKGGCDASRSGGSPVGFVLVGLGAAVVALRRRR